MSVDLDPMVPRSYRVADRTVETLDSVTLRLDPMGDALPSFRPGQFSMLYARGVGEIAISISGDPSAYDGSLIHTIRDVGAVSGALHGSEPGDVLGVRGPFGTDWGLDTAVGRDLVVVAGGVGLAPVRPIIFGALAAREQYGRLVLVVGARSPAEFLFRDQLEEWKRQSDLEVHLTIDLPDESWPGTVGFVTEPLGRVTLDAQRTIAFVCGPEPMMRFSSKVLLDKGVSPTDIRISLERNMQCGVGLCGHCQLGPLLTCRDGPVIDYAQAQPLLATAEL